MSFKLTDPMLRVVTVCVLFIMLLCYLLTAPLRLASFDDAIVARAYVSVVSPQPAFNEARQLTYKPFNDMLMVGNKRQDVWLRLDIAARVEPQVLQIQPAYIQSLTVYAQQADGRWQSTQAGIRHRFSARELSLLNVTVPLPPTRPGELQRVYVQMESDTSGIAVQAIPLAQAQHYDNLLTLSVGLYTGMTLLMIMLAAIAWLVTRESLWLQSVVVDMATLLFSAAQFGLLSRYVLPDAERVVDQIYLLSFCGLVLAIIYFYPRLYRLFSLPGWVLTFYNAFFWLLPVWVVLLMADRGDLLLALNNFLLLVLVLWGMLVVFMARHANTWLLLLFRALLLTMSLVAGYWLWSVVTGSPVSLAMAFYSLAPNNLGSLFILLLILGYHTLLQVQERLRLEVTQHETAARLMSEQARHADTATFLGMIIHEVKNPLNYIRLAAGNLMHDVSGAAGLERLKRIKGSVTAINEVLERSLDVDALEQGALPIRLRPQDMAAFARHFVEDHAQAGRLCPELPERLIAVTDIDLLSMMLRNVVDNALKYSPEGSPVSLVVEQQQGGFRMAVSNAVGAAGLPDPDKLFKKYYRAEGALTVGGLGLGLYWVHEVMRRMGGHIRYFPDHDQVVFELWLPR